LAALTSGLIVASLGSSCTKGAKSAASVRAAASNWKATPEELKNTYPANRTILDPIKFVVTTREGSPVPNIKVEFKAFDVTPAFNGGVSNEAIKAEILRKWSDGNFVMNSAGSIAGNTCDAGFTRDLCVGMLSGPSQVTNQNGEATVGFTTPNAPGGVMAVAMRVPQHSTASELLEMVLVKITSNDDFANSGIEPLQSAILVIPMLFDENGRQVIQAGVPFNLAIYAPGIPNTEPGKGFMFDFATEGLTEAADGSTVIVPTGSKRCEFRNSQCIVPGGPFRVLKPTTLSFSARPSDPKFPVKPSSISLPVITGQASQLILSLTSDTRNIQNACLDADLLNKPCIVTSADTDRVDLYPMLIDAGGNWVESPDTVWSEITGPLKEPNSLASQTVTTGKQTIYPTKASAEISNYDTIKVSVKGRSIYTILRYLITPGLPKKVSIANKIQEAAKPFPVLMELSDRYGNLCYNFSESISMKLSLSPLSDVSMPPATGITSSVTKIGSLNFTTNKVQFTNGKASTGIDDKADEGFLVTRVPPLVDRDQWPRVSITEASLSSGFVTFDVKSDPIQIQPGPVTQTLWRDSAGGLGLSWLERAENPDPKIADPIMGLKVASDQQYNLYLAGYDAAGNFKEDFKDVRIWGINYKLAPSNSEFNAAVSRLFSKDPSVYGGRGSSSCPAPTPRIPLAGRPFAPGSAEYEALSEADKAKEALTYGDPTNQPEDNIVFCGIHAGLNPKAGVSAIAFNSVGIAGTGRVIAIPNSMYSTDGSVLIKPAVTPRLTLVAGAASKFGFEFVSDDEGPDKGKILYQSYKRGEEDVVPTGHYFKIRVHAMDSEDNDSPSYSGVKELQVDFRGDKSWAGIYPVLPTGSFPCEFGKNQPGVCELPERYMLADSRSPGLLAVKQSDSGGVSGTFAKIISTKFGSEKRIFFADKKGGPSQSAVVENSSSLPLGRIIKADSELPLAVAITDAGGSYIRDAVAADQIVYDGFRSDDGRFVLPNDPSGAPPVFDPQTGAWRNTTPWNASYPSYDVFVADEGSANPTGPKFYSPDYVGPPQQITQTTSTNLNKYNIVFVPQNRLGTGFAVPRSVSKPDLIGWPSSWWSVVPGDPEHIETKLVRGSAPDQSWTKPGFESANAEQKTNWVSASDTCYDMVITIHDKKHNKLANFTGVVPNVVFKMINSTPGNPNGSEDLQAGIFAQNYLDKSIPSYYYQTHNQVLSPGPFPDGFYLLGALASDGGGFNSIPDMRFPGAISSLNDWLMTRVTVTTGVITTGVKACLFNGQTADNRNQAVPYMEKFIQVDMPAFTSSDGKTTFPAFQSRGAGIKFTGPGNQEVGSSASAHVHEDKITVFRSEPHHLHPTFEDSVTVSGWSADYGVSSPAVGVSDACPMAPRCGKTNIYWHEHDLAHNFIRAARTDGFSTGATLGSGAKPGPVGVMGSPSTVIFDTEDSRYLPPPTWHSSYLVWAGNNFIPYVAPQNGSPADSYLNGALIKFFPGPPKTLDVSRLGASALTVDAPFGLRVALYDEFGNPSGNQSYQNDTVKFGVDRTLAVRFDRQPSNGPTNGQPRLMGKTGAGLTDPVTRLVKPQPNSAGIAQEFGASIQADNISLVKANESLNLLLTLTDSSVIPFCKQSASNCCFESPSICEAKKDNPRVMSAVFPVNALPGLPAGTIITQGSGPTATPYPSQGTSPADATIAYKALFNTNPQAGETYPLGASKTRTFKTFACARDQFGNIGECDSNAQFSFVGETNPSPVEALSAMLNVPSFNWLGSKPGSFSIQASKNGFTAVTAPITVASRPLSAFKFENITTGTNIAAGSDFQFKVCMVDEADNIIDSAVYGDQGLITDPNAELTVGFSLFGLTPNPEGRSIALSTVGASGFDNAKIELNGAKVQFNQGCGTLFARVFAKGNYNSVPLLTMTYIDSKQGNKPFSGSGIVVDSVIPGAFNHYATAISKAPIVAGAAVVPAFSNPDGPGVNVPATTTGGNRFDLTVYARDEHGNDIDYSGNFDIVLQAQTSAVVSTLKLTCANPSNDNSCLSRAMSGLPVVIPNLAMDVPGIYYVMAKNTDGSGISIETSAILSARASAKTVKEYKIDAGTRSSLDFNGFSVTVRALDNKGDPVIGVASDLNNLTFTWVNDAGQPLSSFAGPFGQTANSRFRSDCVPSLPKPVFDESGTTLLANPNGIPLGITQVGPLKINIRDSQNVGSNNTVSIQKMPWGRNYDVTCTTIAGVDCTGTASSPFQIDATPESRFNLTISSYDHCGNPVVGSSAVDLMGHVGVVEAFNPTTPGLTPGLGGWTDVSMNGESSKTFDNLFMRASGSMAYFIQDLTYSAPDNSGPLLSPVRTYHTYLPKLGTVVRYSLDNVSKKNLKTGEPMTFKLSARDSQGNIVTGVDSLLNAQKYTWFGGGFSPSGEGPIYPTGANPSTALQFIGGSTGTLSVIFKKSEVIPDFYVVDDFVSQTPGVLGFGPQPDLTGKRRSYVPGGYPPEVAVQVTEGLPAKFTLATDSTTVKAGTPFDVKVTVTDKYNNLMSGFGSDTLTFSWSDASSSIGAPVNPVTANAAARDPGRLASGVRTFDPGTSTFSSTGTPFVLYRSNAIASAPQEQPTLTVTGAKTGAQTETGEPLTASLKFTVQPADTFAYAKIASASTYSSSTDVSGKPYTMSNDQTMNFFSHLFDPWGNYKGTDPRTAWTGSSVLANRLLPTPALSALLTPVVSGSGVVTVSCSDVATGCLSDSTGTISIDASPLKAFRVVQVSPQEGADITAGDEVSFKVCMVDESGQVITSPVVVNNVTVTDPNDQLNGISISKSGSLVANPEGQTLRLSTGSLTSFDANEILSTSADLTFVNGCVNLYSRVLAAGTYGLAKPLLSLNYIDTKQNNLPVNGTGLKVGTVAPAALDHYVTEVNNLAPATTGVQAWATPGPNVYSDAGGTRFSIDLHARDVYGNNVPVSKTVNLGLRRVSDSVVQSNQRLKCGLSNNDQSCLSLSLSNTSSANIPFVALDIAGEFYITATDGQKNLLTAKSDKLVGFASKRTVKYYSVTSPTSAVAGQALSIKIEARDAADQVISGADTDLKTLNVSWVDDAGVSLTTGHASPAPSLTAPILPSNPLPFAGGTANVSVTLTKAETGLRINVKDDQTPSVVSTNTTQTNVKAGSQLYYGITCAKVTGGADCSGVSAANAASIDASPTDMFNLTLKAFDQYQNPKTDGALAPQIKLNWESGNLATAVGFLETPTTAPQQYVIPMAGVSQNTMQNFFHRAGPHVISYSVDPLTTSYIGMSRTAYHSFQSHIDMVYEYVTSPPIQSWPNPAIPGATSMVAGTPQNFDLLAIDRAGNIATGLDSLLSAQKYLWSGPTAAPNGDLPVLPGPMTGQGQSLTFSQGKVTGLSATFKNAEVISNFRVIDNYSPSVAGVQYSDVSGKRASYSIPLTVSHATPSDYVITTANTNVKAGSPFDVTVSVIDQFKNPAKTWTADTLTFDWISGAGASIDNPRNGPMTAGKFPAGFRTFTADTARFTTEGQAGQKFVLYKAPETSTLKVTGTMPRALGQPVLTGTLDFTAAQSDSFGYVKIASASTFDTTTSLSSPKSFSMATNDTKTLYAHLFDPWGNYKSNTSPVAWTGTGELENKFSPASAAVTNLTADTVGNGIVSASCSSLDSNCVGDSTALVSVGASPLKDFVVEHTGTPASGASVIAGTEIPMRVCMLDKAGQRITADVWVDGVLKTEASDKVLPLNFAGLNIPTTAENFSVELSSVPGAGFNANKFPLGSASLRFQNGCAPFFVKLYGAKAYSNAAVVSISHTATLQGGINVSGSGLTIAAITPGVLDHYFVNASRLSNSPAANSVPAWAVPGSTNLYADSGGNRFDVNVEARDAFGNLVTVSGQSVTLSTVAADKTTPRPRSLICPAPENDSSCLTKSFSGTNTTFSNLAIDVGGFTFYPVATSGSIMTPSPFIAIAATSSAKTVKSYEVSYPANVTAGAEFTATVVARDAAGALLIGADSDLGTLNFTWQDGVTPIRQLLSTHTAPNGQGPTGAAGGTLSFTGGTATPKLTLTKVETGLIINVRDSQTPAISSTSTATTNVGVGGPTFYALSCKRTDNSDCTGALGSPVAMTGSAADKYNLTIKTFDQYNNPKAVTASPQISITRSAGAAGTAILEQFPTSATRDLNNQQLIVPMVGVDTATISNVFRRSATQTVSMQVDTATVSATGITGVVYHSYSPTIDTVYVYGINNLPTGSVVAGNPYTNISISARDPGGNEVDGIGTALNAQTFTWSGVGLAPDGTPPVLPGVANGNTGPVYPVTGLNFNNAGRSGTFTLTFYKAETLASNSPSGFVMRDNYNGSNGNGGALLTAYRWSQYWSDIIVGHAKASQYVMTSNASTGTNPFAGSPFDVTVRVFDDYLNPATSWASDSLTFNWTNGASSSLGTPDNPKTSTVQAAVRPTSAVSATFSNGVYSTSSGAFTLFRSNLNSLTPQEASTLAVQGSATANTKLGTILSTSLNFTTQPAQAIGYVKIANSDVFNNTTNMSGKALDFSNNSTLSLYAHVFDAYGNYKGNSTSVAWSGEEALLGNVSPANGMSTVVTPASTGSGKVLATCSATITGCIDDQTGTLGVKSAPLASFSIEHDSTPASGATVAAGDEIPLKICMRDSKQQVITQTVVGNDGVTTITNPSATLNIPFAAVGLSNTAERGAMELSAAGGGSFSGASPGTRPVTFVDGCANFFAKVYTAGTYNSNASMLSVSYSDPNQQGISIVGSGLKLAAVNAKSLHHYVTSIGNLASSPQPNTTQAWSAPGTTNQYASAGGNRFDVTVRARDMYGNPVSLLSQTVNLSLQAADGSAVSRSLICVAPTNNSACLSPAITNSDSVTVGNLAIDIGGQFYVKATDANSTPFYASTFSTFMTAATSRRTVKEYIVSAPSTAVAGVGATVTITARDNAGATVVGADADITAAGFDWTDGVDLLSTHMAPDGVTAPILSSPVFSAGTATVSLTLVKAENLTINIRDKQTSPVSSSNAVATAVSAGTVLKYAISCTKDTAGDIAQGADCTGSSATPASILASATDRFSLNIRAYDQYKNPRASGNTAEVLQVDYVSSSFDATNSGYLEQTPLTLSKSGNDLIVNTNNVNGVTISNLFHRGGNHVVSYSVASSPTGMWGQTYHDFKPSRHMVAYYSMTSISSHVAGTSRTFKITAFDRAGNIARNIDSDLTAQAYSWLGAGNPAPDYPSTAAGGISFTNGQSQDLSVTFKKAETLGFYVQDSYNPASGGVAGIGGAGTGGARRSGSNGSAQTIVVSNAVANSFVMTPTTLTPQAGVGFGVTVLARDIYGNTVTNYATDALTFSWSGANSSVTNPKNPTTTFSPITTSRTTGTMNSGQYTSGNDFFLYRTGESPILTVAGSSLSTSVTFSPVPNANHGYVIVTPSGTYQETAALSGPRDIFADQSYPLFAHMFDEYGNYKGNTFSVSWTGSQELAGKLTPTGLSSTLNPTLQGSGTITANCSALTTGCTSFTTGLQTVKPGNINKLAWLSSPASISQTTEQCVKYTIQAQDNNNNPVQVSANTGITFTSSGGNGEFYSSLTECQNAQTGGSTAGAINYALFNSATSLSANNGGRINNILKDSSSVDVWYANRTPTAANGVTITATNGSASNTRTGQITAGASRRVAFTSAVPTINAVGSASTTCAKLDYAIRDAWDNATTTSGTSTVSISSTSSTGGTFHSDAACSLQTDISGTGASVTQTLASNTGSTSIYYKDTRANNATVTIATSGSTLSTNALLEARSLGVNVNPGAFNYSSPALDVTVKDGFTVNWAASPGAQNYTIIYNNTTGASNCSGGTSATVSTNSATLSMGGANGTYFICVIANGFSTNLPQTSMTSNGTYKVVVDNTLPLATITQPASSVTRIGPVTTAMNPGSATAFTGGASDGLSGVSTVEISLLRATGSLYWNGSSFGSASQLWLPATGTNSWTYSINDSNFTDGNYTLSVRSTDNSQNVSTVVTKNFTWKSTVSNATFTTGTTPASNSSATALNVQIGSDDSLVTQYQYAVVSGSSCSGATYNGTWRGIATRITDTLLTADGAYTLCVIGRDEAENTQTTANATPYTWTKDTAAPSVTMPSTPTVNAAFTASPTITDADATLTYSWTFSSGSRCTGATFGTSSAASTTITATTCTNNWGSVTVNLTVTDRAGNSTTQPLTVQWDQQGATVSSISSTLAAGTSCRVGFCGATAQASIPINIVFTKETGNWNRNTFTLTVTGSPTVNLNVRGAGFVGTRTATLTNGTYSNSSGSVTVPATYMIAAGDGDSSAASTPAPGGVVLNVDSAAPFNSPTSVRDNTGTTGTAIANSGVPTSGDSSLQNSNITIDTTAPTPTVALAGPAAQPNFVGFVNDTNKASTSALSAAATANETLSSTVQSRYVLIATATACNSSTTGVNSTVFSTTIPTPSSTGMSTLTDNSTYNICIEATDPAGNIGYAKGPNIVLDRTVPTFASINVPVTQVNNTNSGSTDAVGNNINAGGADATSVTAITYAATKNTTCDGTLPYGSMPTISSGLTSDGVWYLCVRLIDRANNIVYGQAASTINRQTVAAQLTAGTFQWTGDAANYFLNINEQAGTGAILTTPTATRSSVVLSLPASSFTYATTSTTSTDCSALTTWSSTLPNKTTFTTSGTYKACVKITDDAGNVSYAATSDSQNLAVDLVAPTLTFTLANAAENGYVNASARSSGTQLAMVTEGSISTDMVAGSKRYKVIASATTCDNAAVGTSTQTTIPTPSSTDFSGEGSYKICMMAQDTAGNVGYVSSANIVLDTVLPTLGTLSLANSAVGGYINDSEKAHTTALVSYSGGDGTNAVYQVTTTATDAATCAALAAGSYSSTVPTPNDNLPSDTTYRVCVRVQDVALNYSYAISSNIVRDTALPTRSSGFDWINDAANLFINADEKTAANPILSAAVTSDGTIEYAIGTVACASMTGYITTLVNMSNIGADNAAYRACVRMTDVAGNVNYYSPANTIVVDTVTPTLAFSTSPPGNRSNVGATGNTSFTIQPTTADTARYYYSVTAGNNSCTGQTYTAVSNTNSVSINISALADGTITLCTQAEDAAGNKQSDVNATKSQWIKDTVAPLAMTITGPASQVSTSTPTVAWTTQDWVTASDNHTVELYIATNSTCTVGNRLQSYASIAGVASTTQQQLLTALNDGLYYICMFVSDQATNKSNMITSSFEVETDIVHFSYTNSNNVMYARYQNLAWTSETVAANAGGITYDDRTSLQLDNSGTPFVSYKVNDGTNTSFRYSSRNGANSWATASTVQTIASATSTDVGNFNEIAINTLPRLISAFIGRVNSDYGLYMGVNTNDGGASQIAGSPGQFTDAAVAVGPSSNTLFAAAAQSGTLVMVAKDTATATIPAANLPSGCSVQKVSAVAKSDSVVSVALVCSFASSCGVRYADITYSGGTFTAPASASWTSVGTIKSSSCAGLADSERPTIMVDRQNSNAVGIAWESQGGTNYVNFWTNRSGSGVNTQVVSGASAFSEQSLAFDSFGNAYIAYKDGNTFRIVTNNNGSWVSSTAVSGGGLSAIGSIGINGMKGRGNTTSGK
jgi:hypothetical protein